MDKNLSKTELVYQLRSQLDNILFLMNSCIVHNQIKAIDFEQIDYLIYKCSVLNSRILDTND